MIRRTLAAASISIVIIGMLAACTTTTEQQSAPAGGSASGAAPGTITVDVISPSIAAGTGKTKVACTGGSSYKAVAAPVTIGGQKISLTVAVATYSGPGNYSATVTAGEGSSATPVKNASVTITAKGGVVSLPANAKDVAGSFAWACS